MLTRCTSITRPTATSTSLVAPSATDSGTAKLGASTCLGGSLGVLARSAYQGASNRRSAHAAPGSQPGVPSPRSVSHALRGFIFDVRAALFHAADALRFFPSKLYSFGPTFPHSSCGDPSSTLPVHCRCRPVTRRPRGLLSDQKPYLRHGGISRRIEAVAPLVVSSPETLACAKSSNGWPFSTGLASLDVGRGALQATAIIPGEPGVHPSRSDGTDSEAPRCGEAFYLRSLQ